MTGFGLSISLESEAGAVLPGRYLVDGLNPEAILDFRAGRYMLSGADVTLSAVLTLTRSTTATYVDASGAVQTAAANVPRFDWANGVPQLLIEGASSNFLRNSQMAGAAPGTPGTLPTNWFYDVDPGLTYSIVGTGTFKGLPYIDIRLQGVTSNTFTNIHFESQTGIATATNQDWTASAYAAVIGGSLANISATQISIFERTSAGAYVTGGAVSIALSSALTRFALPRVTSGGATVGCVESAFTLTYASGAAIDVTVRLAAPQLEHKSCASSFIPTSGTTVVRAADLPQLTNAAAAILQGAAASALVQGQAALPPWATPSIILGSGDTGSAATILSTDATVVNRLIFGGAAGNTMTFGSGDRSGAFGAVAGWDGSGRLGCVNGGTVASATGSLAFSGGIWIGSANGTSALARMSLDALILYPFKLSSGAAQGKAVAYG